MDLANAAHVVPHPDHPSLLELSLPLPSFLSSLKYLQAKAPPAPLTAVEFRPGASVRQHRLHQLPAASAPEDWNIKEVFRWSLQSKQNIIQPNSQS
jgi:hypothetical protein